MQKVVMYSTSWCGFCTRARQLLKAKNVPFEEIDASDATVRRDVMARSGQRTVPQIWIGDEHIGGCDELYALEQSGQLDRKLQGGSQE